MKLTSLLPGVFCCCYDHAVCLTIICADINTIFTINFDAAKSRSWVQTAGITLGLSLGVMAFVDVFVVWLVPSTFLGLAIIVLVIGFIVVAATCEMVVSNALGNHAVGVCS